MKKTLLFMAAVLISVSLFAQTRASFISEHFDGSSTPDGWQVQGAGTSNWGISATQNAGGEANELVLVWSPQFNGTSRVVMPAVDLTGVSSVVVSFKHALDNYSGGHTIGVATSSDGGTTWNVGWQQSYSTSNVWSVTENITTADMGNSNVQFCLFYTGNSYNINNWYFDDIEIFSMENLDLALNSINMNNTIGAGTAEIAFTVQNKGVETINNFKMSYQIDEEEPVEEVFDASMASLATQQLTFAVPVNFIPGSYNLTINIVEVNSGDDDDPSNNMLEKTIGVALGETQKIPMIEHFSSSTCGPCVSVNSTMLSFCNNHPGQFTYTKYQMNWPGNGDPYYTAEGGTRRTYYGVQAVPQCFLDGVDQGYAAVATSVFDEHYAEPAFADVRGSFNVSGNTITVKVDFMSYYDMTTEKCFVSVNEKETHGNVGSNGETSFHHIFMKFLTSASGTALNIPAGGCQHFEWTQDLSSTHVEEMTDLEVAAWIQNMSTHEVINSHFMYEYTDIHPYPVQELNINLNEGTLTATWDAPEGGNALSYNVYLNGVFDQNVTNREYTTYVTDEFNVIAVEALYADDMTSVKMVASTNQNTTDCDPVTDLTVEPYVEEGVLGALISWTEPEGATEYDIYADGEYLGTVEEQPVFLNFEDSPYDVYTIGVVVVYGDECESAMVTVEYNWTSVHETANATSLYPNPTDGNFTVESANMAKVEVYNLVGQKVCEQQGNVITIDASSWNKGIYMVNIIGQNGSVETKKLVVR